MGSRAFAAGALLLAAAGAAAQDATGKFGVAVAGAGDVNGDGVPDLVVGAPEARPAGRYDAGRGTVHSGKDGSVLFAFGGASSIEFLGVSVAGPGDVNGDGKPDVAVGASRAKDWKGAVRVFSGTDGSLLWEAVGVTKGESLGAALAVAGDLDADGIADLLAGAPDATVGDRKNCGVARVLSGKDGRTLLSLEGQAKGEGSGSVVASLGDLDGEGKPDFAAGSPPTGHGMKSGPLRLFSGKDGSVLFEVPGGLFQASSVTVIEDRNAGGGKRLAIGSPMAVWGGNMAGGLVRILSPGDGKELAKWPGKTTFDAFGFALAAPGDMNGDGVTDLWVTAMGGEAVAEELGKPKDPAGRIDLVSGKDGTVIRTIRSTKFGEMLGAALAVPGDLNADGVPDLLAGAPGAGEARVYSGKDGSVLLTLRPPPEK